MGSWFGGVGSSVTPTADNVFVVPQTGPAATASGHYVTKAQMDAADVSWLARVPAPTLLTSQAHVAGDRRTHTDWLAYTCNTGGAAIGETPTTHPAKWTVSTVGTRVPEMGYFRLTGAITPTASASLQGAWAAESGFTNTVQQVTIGGIPVFRLKASRWYNCELYPHVTGIATGGADYWEWRTVAGVALPATAVGGSAYALLVGLVRDEMGAVVKGWIQPSVDTDVTIYCNTVSGGSLNVEGTTRATSIFINEMASRILI